MPFWVPYFSFCTLLNRSCDRWDDFKSTCSWLSPVTGYWSMVTFSSSDCFPNIRSCRPIGCHYRLSGEEWSSRAGPLSLSSVPPLTAASLNSLVLLLVIRLAWNVRKLSSSIRNALSLAIRRRRFYFHRTLSRQKRSKFKKGKKIYINRFAHFPSSSSSSWSSSSSQDFWRRKEKKIRISGGMS